MNELGLGVLTSSYFLSMLSFIVVYWFIKHDASFDSEDFVKSASQIAFEYIIKHKSIL